MPFLKAWEVVRRKRKSVIANSFKEEESEKKLIHLSVIIVKEGILFSA